MRVEPKQRGRGFPFLQINEREGKPRKRGLTEIRGPYYSVVGTRYLEDLFETMGAYVDSLKFAGGSFTLMHDEALKKIIDLCHRYHVLVSSGGFIERVLPQAEKPCGNTSRNASALGSTSSKSQPVSFRFRPKTGCG